MSEYVVPDRIEPVVAARSWFAITEPDTVPGHPQAHEAWEGLDIGLMSIHNPMGWSRGRNTAAPCRRLQGVFAGFANPEDAFITIVVGTRTPQGGFDVTNRVNGTQSLSFRKGFHVYTCHIYFDDVLTGYEPEPRFSSVWCGDVRYPVSPSTTEVKIPVADIAWTITDTRDNTVRTRQRITHDPPGEMCTCGLYAASAWSQIPVVNITANAFDGETWTVVGTVSLTGRVIAGERGWRAEHQEITGLFSLAAYPRDTVHRRRKDVAAYDDLLHRVAEVYGVPVLGEIPPLTDPQEV